MYSNLIDPPPCANEYNRLQRANRRRHLGWTVNLKVSDLRFLNVEAAGVGVKYQSRFDAGLGEGFDQILIGFKTFWTIILGVNRLMKED